ncbi:MAG TPA: DUF1080 domain-containing protein [Pirellulales bacterium]|jgi:hypothetical protein
MKLFLRFIFAGAIVVIWQNGVKSIGAAEADPSSGQPGPWVELFDGKSLDGWKPSEATDSFYVQDGCIVADGKPRSHLFYMADPKPFKNFELEAQVKTEPGANSGIYFHTQYQERDWPNKGYEAQINNTFPPDPRRTGSLYGISDVKDPPTKDNEWFKYNIKVDGKHVVLKLDDQTVVDYTEPDEPPKYQGRDRKLSDGTFALQAHPKAKGTDEGGGRTFFRSVKVRRLPD